MNTVNLVNMAETRLRDSQRDMFYLLRNDIKNVVIKLDSMDTKIDSNKKDMDTKIDLNKNDTDTKIDLNKKDMETKIDDLSQLKYLMYFLVGLIVVTMPQFSNLISLLVKFFKL